jgi:Transglycosylase SLT domain
VRADQRPVGSPLLTLLLVVGLVALVPDEARQAPANRSAREGTLAPTAGRPRPSGHAHRAIPPAYLARYQRAAGRCHGLSWAVLAAIGKVESDHGRTRAYGVRSGANWAGAAGPMQFGIGGRAGNTWAAYRVDGDRDGRSSVYDPDDAIPAAADYLCAHGAPRRLRRAVWAYNHSAAYVANVLRMADRYRVGGDGP